MTNIDDAQTGREFRKPFFDAEALNAEESKSARDSTALECQI